MCGFLGALMGTGSESWMWPLTRGSAHPSSINMNKKRDHEGRDDAEASVIVYGERVDAYCITREM